VSTNESALKFTFHVEVVSIVKDVSRVPSTTNGLLEYEKWEYVHESQGKSYEPDIRSPIRVFAWTEIGALPKARQQATPKRVERFMMPLPRRTPHDMMMTGRATPYKSLFAVGES
jgi:hypothetical protein